MSCEVAAGWKELVRWILSWQPDVRVLAPAALRKRVIEKVRQALEISLRDKSTAGN